MHVHTYKYTYIHTFQLERVLISTNASHKWIRNLKKKKISMVFGQKFENEFEIWKKAFH